MNMTDHRPSSQYEKQNRENHSSLNQSSYYRNNISTTSIKKKTSIPTQNLSESFSTTKPLGMSRRWRSRKRVSISPPTTLRPLLPGTTCTRPQSTFRARQSASPSSTCTATTSPHSYAEVCARNAHIYAIAPCAHQAVPRLPLMHASVDLRSLDCAWQVPFCQSVSALAARLKAPT